MVVMTAPEMLPIIAMIPSAQFNPAADNFAATVKQVFVTMGMVAPQATGMDLAALAGPAHTGLFARTAQMDTFGFNGNRTQADGWPKLSASFKAARWTVSLSLLA